MSPIQHLVAILVTIVCVSQQHVAAATIEPPTTDHEIALDSTKLAYKNPIVDPVKDIVRISSNKMAESSRNDQALDMLASGVERSILPSGLELLKPDEQRLVQSLSEQMISQIPGQRRLDDTTSPMALGSQAYLHNLLFNSGQPLELAASRARQQGRAPDHRRRQSESVYNPNIDYGHSSGSSGGARGALVSQRRTSGRQGHTDFNSRPAATAAAAPRNRAQESRKVPAMKSAKAREEDGDGYDFDENEEDNKENSSDRRADGESKNDNNNNNNNDDDDDEDDERDTDSDDDKEDVQSNGARKKAASAARASGRPMASRAIGSRRGFQDKSSASDDEDGDVNDDEATNLAPKATPRIDQLQYIDMPQIEIEGSPMASQQQASRSTPNELQTAAGHHHGHHGHYYQYVEVPKKKTWKFGFKRGNHKHEIMRHEKGHKHKFHSTFKWHAKEKCKKKKKCKSVGKMTWDYKHHKKHHG